MTLVLSSKKPSDLSRILALPQREPVDCEREKGVRRWTPAAQALIEIVTARYTRGLRLSCACRDRHVQATSNGGLVVFLKGRDGLPPPPPVETTIASFCRDAAHEEDAVKVVSQLRTGQSVDLPGLGYQFCLTEFNPAQAWILYELPVAGGIFGMISVGGGKTIAGIMAPMSMPHLKTWVVLAKPDQRLHYRNAYLRLREHFQVPSIIFDQQTDLKGSYVELGKPRLHFLPYSILSNKKSTTLLEMLDPDGVIADESHYLANKGSSRTMRFLRAMAMRERVFCNWSGSTIKRSMKDVAHLSAHALGLGSPYPILPHDVEAMSAVVDPSPIPDRTSDMAIALLDAFGTRKTETSLFMSGFGSDGGVREGHRDRVVRTLGVVSTRSSSVNCSLSIKKFEVSKVPAIVMEALQKARAGVRPDGMELVAADESDALSIAACSREVAAGYYSYWAYPKHPCACPPNRVLDSQMCSECKLITAWFAARKAWNKELRVKLQGGEPRLDSPSLCEDAAKRAWQIPRYEGDLPVWPAAAWPAWVEIKDKVEYEPRVKWIGHDLPEAKDPETHLGLYLARDVAKWARENVGVVWCRSRAFGKKVAELAGVNYHGGGVGAEERILAEDGSKSIVATIGAHGTGRDGLQFKFWKQLVVEPPASGDAWEQLLGRLVREGQPQDEVETWIPWHLPEFRDPVRKAYVLAEHIEATTPNRQLLLAADDFGIR